MELEPGEGTVEIETRGEKRLLVITDAKGSLTVELTPEGLCYLTNLFLAESFARGATLTIPPDLARSIAAQVETPSPKSQTPQKSAIHSHLHSNPFPAIL